MIGWHLPLHYRHLPHHVDGLPVLFASSVARRIAVTFLALFSPLYILNIALDSGFSLNFSVAVVFTYFFLVLTTKAATFPLAEKFSLSYGFKGVLLLSGLPFLLFIPLLVFTSELPFLLFPAAVFWGAHTGFFWWGYHGFFIKSGKAISFGEEIGAATIFETLAMVIAPVFGALVIAQFGFASLFWLAGLIFLFSLALLVPASAHKPKTHSTVSEVTKLIFSHKKIAVAYLGNGAESIWHLAVWPVFLFLIFKTTLEVGGIVSLAVLLSALLTFLVGVWTDRGGERRLISLGSPLLSLSWLLRTLGTNLGLFVFADGLWRFAQGMVALPLNVLTYEKALEGSSNKAIMFRELTVTAGGILAMFILVIWALLGLSLAGTFILAAAFSLFPLISVKTGSVHEHRVV